MTKPEWFNDARCLMNTRSGLVDRRIRETIADGWPLKLNLLRDALAFEQSEPHPRQDAINILRREIARQDRLQLPEAVAA